LSGVETVAICEFSIKTFKRFLNTDIRVLTKKNFFGFSQYPVRKSVKETGLGSTGTAGRVSRTEDAGFFEFAIDGVRCQYHLYMRENAPTVKNDKR
jgi:hypothetical protein